jgi:hypothetical protein
MQLVRQRALMLLRDIEKSIPGIQGSVGSHGANVVVARRL